MKFKTKALGTGILLALSIGVLVSLYLWPRDNGNSSSIPVCKLVQDVVTSDGKKLPRFHIADFYVTTSANNDCQLVKEAWEKTPNPFGSIHDYYCICNEKLGQF